MKGHYTFPSAQCTHHYHQNCYETILNSLNISIICLPKLLLNALATFLLVFFFFTNILSSVMRYRPEQQILGTQRFCTVQP